MLQLAWLFRRKASPRPTTNKIDWSPILNEASLSLISLWIWFNDVPWKLNIGNYWCNYEKATVRKTIRVKYNFSLSNSKWACIIQLWREPIILDFSHSWPIGQAKKSARGMPWHQEPMKDVISCDKLRGAANKQWSGDFRMGKPSMSSHGNVWWIK